MDAIIAALITAAFAIVLAVGATYRSTRDNIDAVKDKMNGIKEDMSKELNSKCDAINSSIQDQGQKIAEVNGKVSVYNNIRQSCMARFEAIEHNVTILHTTRARKRRKEA